MSKYVHKYTPWWKGGGGGGSYDDTAIKRRITALESGKQNVLVGGDGIILLNDTISAVNILNDTRESSTTVWSSNKVKSLFESLTGKVNVSIVATKPPKSSAVNNTMYYVGTESPYRIWFFVNDDYTDFGSTALDLSDYFTKDEVNDLLEEKVDKVTGKSLVLDTDITQITTNKTDIANIKDDENLTSFGKVKLEFDKKQDKITDSTLSTLTDSTTVSSVSATDKTNKTFALSALWTWITGKLSTTISSSSTDVQIPSAKAVWDSVYTDVLNYNTMSSLDDILSEINVSDGCSKFAYITNLTPVQTAGASSNEGYIKVSLNGNKAMIEFFPSDKGERWWVIKNTTWGDWTNGAKYMHTLARYINDAKEYTVGWFSIINEKKTMTYAEMGEWLKDNGHTTLAKSYHYCGGCAGSTEVRNATNTGSVYVGIVVSGVFWNESENKIYFKTNYNGSLSIQSTRCTVISERLS